MPLVRYQPKCCAPIAPVGLGALVAASINPALSVAAVLNRPILQSAGVSRVPAQNGYAFQHSASNGNVDFGAAAGFESIIPVENSFSVFLRVYVSTLGVRQAVFGDHNAAGTNESCSIEITAGNQWRAVLVTGTTPRITTSGTATATIGWHDVLLVYRQGVGTQLYVDGILVGTTGFNAILRAGSALRLGSFGTFPTVCFLGRTAVFHIFRGDVSAQIKALSDNPWQIFLENEEYEDVILASPKNQISANWTELGDVVSTGALVKASASIAYQENSEVHSLLVSNVVRSDLAWSEVADINAASVTSKITAGISWIEASDSIISTVRSEISLSAIWNEIGDTQSVSVSIGSDPAATLSWTERPDIFALVSTVKQSISANWTENREISAVSISVGSDVEGIIDIDSIPGSRRVVFEGSKRVLMFEGSKRMVRFDGSDNPAELV